MRDFGKTETILNHQEKLRVAGATAAHLLSDAFLKTKSFGAARMWCLRAIDGREKMLGYQHPLLYQSINLFADICDVKGSYIEGEEVRFLLPFGFQGINSFPLILIKRVKKESSSI